MKGCFCNRDMETVLREDREALRSMQKHQPRFTEDQKRELSQVHPWVRTGRLPRAINISVRKAQRGTILKLSPSTQE